MIAESALEENASSHLQSSNEDVFVRSHRAENEILAKINELQTEAKKRQRSNEPKSHETSF
jgi:hypothetical protein